MPETNINIQEVISNTLISLLATMRDCSATLKDILKTLKKEK